VDVARDAAQRPQALSSRPPKERQAERLLLMQTILSVNLVTHIDISLVTVRTANQTPWLIRRSVTLHGPKNKAQTCELEEIDKLNQEIGQLRVFAAESAGAAGSEEEGWTSREDTRAAKGAVNHKHYFLSPPPCVNPSKSYLIAAVAPLSCVSDTRD